MKPIASRPKIPKVYGVPADTDKLLPWPYVQERMESSKHYWLATVGPDGAPHTRPVDGIWFDDRFYFSGSTDSRWRKNLAQNPLACINLEDGWQAVILHGTAEPVRAERRLAERLAEASNAKYGYGQTPEDWQREEFVVFVPSVVFAWTTLYEDATRWRFDS